MDRARLGALIVILFIVCSTGGSAYLLNGPKWAVGQVPYYINPVNMDVSEADATAAIQVGAMAWSAQSNANISFYYMGRTNGASLTNNGKNEVFFRNEADGSVLARTYWWYNSRHELIDADIVFYDGGFRFFTGSTGCQNGIYLEDVATHEFGHALGLGHSSVKSATMYGSTSWCATSGRSLDSDDLAGVEELYPPTGSSNTAPTVSISSPQNRSSYEQGTSISFSGSASDAEDGSLSSRLAWTSSIDGNLGTGASLTKTLSPGNHVVTAKVSDSGGLSGSSQVAVTVTTSNTAPAVTISAPTNNTSIVEGTLVAFSGSASDKEDGSLGGQLVWTSSRDGRIGTGATFSRALSVGTHTVVASVSDSGGLSASAQVTVTVNAVVNAAPSVSISAPQNGSSFTEGTSITFTGSASDAEDGNLTSKIVWTSSVDGPLGMGGSVTKVLSTGTHTVTASVTDSAGQLATKQLSIAVSGSPNVPAPSQIRLSASGYKVRGSPHVDLSWSGAVSSKIDLYRNGVKVATVANTGSYTDALPKKGGGTATYTVCEAGTSTCSSAVVASF